MQIILNSSQAGESLTAPKADSIAEVRLSFHPTIITVALNDTFDYRPVVADFKSVLTAAEPGNNVDSLTWATTGPWQFRYAHQVQGTASIASPPMEVFSPDLNTPVGTLFFDKLEAGQPCAIENTETGKLYTRMRILNNDGSLGVEADLKFISGTVLLVG
jgi:hypothetical protein